MRAEETLNSAITRPALCDLSERTAVTTHFPKARHCLRNRSLKADTPLRPIRFSDYSAADSSQQTSAISPSFLFGE